MNANNFEEVTDTLIKDSTATTPKKKNAKDYKIEKGQVDLFFIPW